MELEKQLIGIERELDRETSVAALPEITKLNLL